MISRRRLTLTERWLKIRPGERLAWLCKECYLGRVMPAEPYVNSHGEMISPDSPGDVIEFSSPHLLISEKNSMTVIPRTREHAEGSPGICTQCQGTFPQAAMAKHLGSCWQETITASRQRRPPFTWYHLMVDGEDRPRYWMRLAVRADARLKDLDVFLRRQWLECCGHMSAFTLDGREYRSGARGMDVRADKLFRSGLKFRYEYDFGTTTALALRVIAEWQGGAQAAPIMLLAQNVPPLIPCEQCKAPAIHVCAECAWNDEGWLCAACASRHHCGEDMLLPVVNSPRVGMCGYEGQS